MGVIGGMPLQLRHDADPENLLRRKAQPYEPVRYAFVLIDLVGGHDGPASKIYAVDKGRVVERMSDKVTWRLTCRTNGDGVIVPCDPLATKDTEGVRKWIDKTRPVIFNAGQEFNLWWSRDVKHYIAARDAARRAVTREVQLCPASTMIATDDGKALLAIFVKADPKFQKLKVKSRQELLARVEREAMRDPRQYAREVVALEADVPVSSTRRQKMGLASALEYLRLAARLQPYARGSVKLGLQPHLSVEDFALEHALVLSAQIQRATRAIADEHVVEYIAHLERLLDIIERRGKEKSLNDVIGLKRRQERSEHLFSNARFRLYNTFDTVASHIRRLGSRLERIYAVAIDEAIWHYPRDTALRYCGRILQAMGIALADDLRKSLLEPADITASKKILAGTAPPASGAKGVEKFLAAVERVCSLAGPGTGVVGKASEFIEGFLGHLSTVPTSDTGRVARYAGRIVELIHVVEQGPAPPEVAYDGSTSLIELDGDRPKASVRSTVRAVGKLVERADKVLKAIDIMFATRQLIENPDFKSMIKAAGSAADAASAIERVYERVRSAFGLSKAGLTRIAGASAAVCSFLEIPDALGKGNNLAVLGHLLSSACGIAQIFARGNLAVSLFIAALALAGAIIIYFALDEEEKYCLYFDDHVWDMARWAPDYVHKALRDDGLLDPVDKFIEQRFGEDGK